jgi:carotenoid cleavage dioxygenase-like enzyme
MSQLNGVFAAAHEEHDPYVREFFNFVTIPGANITYRMFCIKLDGTTEIMSDIVVPRDRGLSYIHSSASTPNYLILIAPPVFVGWNGLKIIWTRSISDSISYHADMPVHFYIIDRKARMSLTLISYGGRLGSTLRRIHLKPSSFSIPLMRLKTEATS